MWDVSALFAILCMHVVDHLLSCSCVFLFYVVVFVGVAGAIAFFFFFSSSFCD